MTPVFPLLFGPKCLGSLHQTSDLQGDGDHIEPRGRKPSQKYWTDFHDTYVSDDKLTNKAAAESEAVTLPRHQTRSRANATNSNPQMLLIAELFFWTRPSSKLKIIKIRCLRNWILHPEVQSLPQTEAQQVRFLSSFFSFFFLLEHGSRTQLPKRCTFITLLFTRRAQPKTETVQIIMPRLHEPSDFDRYCAVSFTILEVGVSISFLHQHL